MAVNKTVNKKTKSHGAMRNCIEYVLREDKTGSELTYVTGPYVYDEVTYDLVYRTFLEEKRLWNKDSGRMYTHNIISWHKDELITPEEAFAFGKEFAEQWFAGFQTLVSVHRDREHIHCHFVTNTVSFEDGHKLHTTKKDMEKMKQLTNQMCRSRGLTVSRKGFHFDSSEMEKGEITAWSKDKYNLFRNSSKKSYVADCAMAVLNAMVQSVSKNEFVEKMKTSGWKVIWNENRKHITFQDQEGRKVRDSNLSKTFHLDISKEALENEFIRYSTARSEQRKQTGQAIAGSIPDTETLIRESKTANESAGKLVHASKSDRRKSSTENRSVRDAETQSIAVEEQRHLEEQTRIATEERARAARRRSKSRSGPDR